MNSPTPFPKAIELPELTQFSLRLGTSPEIRNALLKDPLLFGAYFALVTPFLSLPEALNVPARLERAELMDLLEQLSHRMGSRVSAEFVTLFADSQAAYEHYTDHPEEFDRLLAEAQLRMVPLFTRVKDHSILEQNISRLAGLLELSAPERQILALTLCTTLSLEFDIVCTLLLESASMRVVVWRTLLNLTMEEFKTVFSSKNLLARTGLVTMDPSRARLFTLRPFWVNLLLEEESDDRFFLKIVKPFEPVKSSHALGRIQPEDEDILTTLLSHQFPTPCKGVNVLLHGARGVDKQAVLGVRLKTAGQQAYSLVTDEAKDEDLPALCYIAQRWMQRHRPNDIFVVEKAHAVLTRSQTQFYFVFQIEPEDDQEARSIDARLLLDCPVRTFWITSSSKLLTEDNIGRFIYHCEVKKASRLERRAHIESVITGLGLSAALEKELIQYEGLSEQQLKSALALASLTGAGDPARMETCIRHAILRSQQALDRRSKDDLRTSVTAYSLAYLNTSGRFKPDQILKALMNRPSASLCLYGLPGTGKTQLAEHIASMLGKPLLKKHASELLDKYVGETEKRLSAMFQEAEEEEAVLLLDEADSFLRDRARSEHQWQISQVNELLQRMEQFQGTFICATNLFRQLDVAALRRFTFKLEFLPLTETQRWAMFVNETGISPETVQPALQDEWQTRLVMMRNLTPGDFATVKRQSLLLGETLSPEDWLEQLALEVRIKMGDVSDTADILR